MSFKHYKTMDVLILVIVTQFQLVLSQDASVDLDPHRSYENASNIHSNENNFYSEPLNNDADNVGNQIQENWFSEQPLDANSERQKADSETDEPGKKEDCWMTLNAAEYFRAMDDLDNEFREIRQTYQMNVAEAMDRQMLDELLGSGGAAPRAIHNFDGIRNRVPAGINLGGYCMMREQDSMLFFHRMKLRNSTYFTTNYIHNDFENMLLLADISLNDLHLLGSYERSATHKDPSILYYRPSYGTVQVLLRNVSYRMEGRMRMMADRLTVELINSEMVINDDILMSYLNTNITEIPEYTVKLHPSRLDDFLQRLKTDLDLWLKDFFNDFFMYFQLPEYDNSKIQAAEKKKTILLNEYVNFAVNSIRQKIYDLGGHVLTLPKFTVFTVPNMIIKIYNGVLRGMDSMYRRSVATGKKNGHMRNVDVIVGFSKLKAEYKLEAVLPNGTPPLNGNLMLSADELTTHMGMILTNDPESLDLNFDFIQQMKPESLSIEGPTNRLVSNFKHLLEHQIISLISNAMMHNVKMLNTLTRCVPFIYGHIDEESPNITHYLRSPKESKRRLRRKKIIEGGNRIQSYENI